MKTGAKSDFCTIPSILGPLGCRFRWCRPNLWGFFVSEQNDEIRKCAVRQVINRFETDLKVIAGGQHSSPL